MHIWLVCFVCFGPNLRKHAKSMGHSTNLALFAKMTVFAKQLQKLLVCNSVSILKVYETELHCSHAVLRQFLPNIFLLMLTFGGVISTSL